MVYSPNNVVRYAIRSFFWIYVKYIMEPLNILNLTLKICNSGPKKPEN